MSASIPTVPTGRLLPQHDQLIRASGISDAVREARGYWSATTEPELAALDFAKSQRRVPALVVPVRTTDGQVPLVITEGARRADSAASHCLCCVGLLGVDGWRGTNAKRGKTALPDWNDVALNWRTVYLAFDADLADKAPVQRALRALTS